MAKNMDKSGKKPYIGLNCLKISENRPKMPKNLENRSESSRNCKKWQKNSKT